MKRLLLFMVLILPFMLSSCGDDEPTNLEQLLIGEWVEIVENPNDIGYVVHITFKSDHTGSYWETYNNKVYRYPSFSWSVTGNRLTTIVDGESESTTFSIKNDILHIDIDDMDLKRVK